MLFISILIPQFAMAQDIGDTGLCDQWGEIQPDTVTNVNLGETYKFHISGQNCGDTSLCNWSMDPSGMATLSSTTGSPVDWTAPTELEDCISEEIRLLVECPTLSDDGTINDELILVVSCTLAEKEALIGAQDWTVDGGGCTTSATALLLIPFFFGWRRFG